MPTNLFENFTFIHRYEVFVVLLKEKISEYQVSITDRQIQTLRPSEYMLMLDLITKCVTLARAENVIYVISMLYTVDDFTLKNTFNIYELKIHTYKFSFHMLEKKHEKKQTKTRYDFPFHRNCKLQQ